VAALALPALAQTPRPTPRPPVFGAEIEVINLNVSITDARGQYVSGLNREDFAVFEDGIKQDLSIFAHENLPISMVLMVDTSASMDVKLPMARTAGKRFVRTLRAQDMAQVMQFNDRATVLQDFTNDHAALEAAFDRTEASGPTALHNALYVALKDLEKQKSGAELRRRALILLSDGEDTASLVSDDQVLELARKAEINIYAISLRARTASERNRLKFSQAAHLLTALTQDTGGQVHFPNSLSELEAVYDRIAEELRTQYSLGFVSSNKRADGKWRRIVVRVAGREDLKVRQARVLRGRAAALAAAQAVRRTLAASAASRVRSSESTARSSRRSRSESMSVPAEALIPACSVPSRKASTTAGCTYDFRAMAAVLPRRSATAHTAATTSRLAWAFVAGTPRFSRATAASTVPDQVRKSLAVKSRRVTRRR
jgi:Ca-activated chloride channel family protein